MKPALITTGRLGKKLLIILFITLFPFLGKATIGTYVSPANVNSPPQVDATNFYNAGTWNIISDPTPYETFHTLNYYNKGSMTCEVGWEFDLGPLTNGGRGWSTTFTNDNSGTISALDGPLYSPLDPVSLPVGSYLLVSATNIVNKGLLSAQANGEIILNGSLISLARSPIEITPIVATGSSNGKTNFTSDTAIYDELWAQTNITFDSEIIWDGFFAETPSFDANVCGGTITGDQFGFVPVLSDSIDRNSGFTQTIITNSDAVGYRISYATNFFRQADFINANTNQGIIAESRFSNSGNVSNLFVNVAARFSAAITNSITRVVQTNTLYLIDTLAASTNLGLLPNNHVINPSLQCQLTERPRNYILSRTEPILPTGAPFSGGFIGDGTPPPDFYYPAPVTGSIDDTNGNPIAPPLNYYESGFSNEVVNARYAAYSATIDNLANEPAVGLDISNAPGKIHIYANNLDLTQTRMRAESEIIIQASNLVNSAGATIDCQNLNYNLGSTNGFLNITNLIVNEVSRFSGSIIVWSGVWSNSATLVLDNYFISNSVITVGTNSFTNAVPVYAPITNNIQYNLAATIIDGSGLKAETPVTVQSLILHSTNVIISDSITFGTTNFYLDSKSLTILGRISLGSDFFGNSADWTHAIAPNLKYFTNNGTISMQNTAHFGDDSTNHYTAFVNHGGITAGGQEINSDYFEISGGANNASTADFTLVCRTGLVMNAQITALDDISLTANNLIIDPSFIETTDGSLNFTVSNLLSDAGYGTGNSFSCQNGFNLFIKPIMGDLLGTEIDDYALADQEVDHLWAGKDFGASVAGYSNNVAIGTLALIQENDLFEPLFRFTGANAGNGLYVSNLDLSTLTDYTNEIQIDPNIIIYYVSVTPNLADPNVVITTTPEDFYDGQFGGHLRHVSGVTGLNQIKMSGSNPSGGKFQLTLSNLPLGQTNIIQASTNMTVWTPIYTNLGNTTSLQFMDPKASNYPSRFYRVVPKP